MYLLLSSSFRFILVIWKAEFQRERERPKEVLHPLAHSPVATAVATGPHLGLFSMPMAKSAIISKVSFFARDCPLHHTVNLKLYITRKITSKNTYYQVMYRFETRAKGCMCVCVRAQKGDV